MFLFSTDTYHKLSIVENVQCKGTFEQLGYYPILNISIILMALKDSMGILYFSFYTHSAIPKVTKPLHIPYRMQPQLPTNIHQGEPYSQSITRPESI